MDLLTPSIYRYIFSDILKEMRYFPIAIILGVLLYFVIVKVFRHRRKPVYNTMLIIYFIMLFIITIFEREPGSRTGISVKLFETFGNSRANAYVIENVLLFIPFGILTPLVWKRMRHPFICTFLGFCLSCMIELTQLVTERGHFQVDDIMTNTIGSLIGSLIFTMLLCIVTGFRVLFRHSSIHNKRDISSDQNIKD